MTKTLTEQWRDGTLPEGLYYVVREWDDEIRMLYFEGDYFLDTDVPLDNDNIKEVLAPVPNYDEYKRLQERNEKLEKMAFHYTPEEWNTMLRTIERLQEQLNEANKTIKKAQELCPDKNVMLMCNPARPSFGMMTNDVLTKYLKKWGVK